MDGLAEIQSRYPVLGDIRGPGLMVGCEFTDPDTGQPRADIVKNVTTHAFEEGNLILLTCGMCGNAIRWTPPLVVTEAQINEGLGIFERAI